MKWNKINQSINQSYKAFFILYYILFVGTYKNKLCFPVGFLFHFKISILLCQLCSLLCKQLLIWNEIKSINQSINHIKHFLYYIIFILGNLQKQAMLSSRVPVSFHNFDLTLSTMFFIVQTIVIWNEIKSLNQSINHIKHFLYYIIFILGNLQKTSYASSRVPVSFHNFDLTLSTMFFIVQTIFIWNEIKSINQSINHIKHFLYYIIFILGNLQKQAMLSSRGSCFIS